MHVTIPKNATPEEVRKALEQFKQKRRNRKLKSGKGNIAKHFGSNPNEVDGLKFSEKSKIRMGLVIADTNIIIYYIKGLKIIEPYTTMYDFAVSEFSIIELLGVKNIDSYTLKKRKEILNDCKTLHYNSYIREIAIKIKQTYTFKIPDALIAATSIHYDIPLLTADKDFKKVEDLEVIILNF